MDLRPFQSEYLRLLKDIKASTANVRTILAEVYPGSGKSLLPVLTAMELCPSVLDGVVWVVPRLALQTQGAKQFGDTQPWLDHDLECRESTNDVDPFRGHRAIVTTYQALLKNPGLLEYEFRRKRLGLIADEFHHLVLDGDVRREERAYYSAIKPLIDMSKFTLAMSGGIMRASRTERVALLPYRRLPDGYEFSWEDPLPADWRVIRYPFSAAHHDEVVISTDFYLLDAELGWTNGAGDDRNIMSFDEVKREERAAALGTALQTEAARHVLEANIRSYLETLRDINPHAKQLTIAARIERAVEYVKWLKDMGVERVGIATSADSEAAIATIARWKRPNSDPGSLQVLVTVGMAYEGLDCPEATHEAFLTHIRSESWMLQAMNRVTRFDRNCGLTWREQNAVIHGPKDALLHAYVRRYEQERDSIRIKDPGDGPPPPPSKPVIPGDGRWNGKIYGRDPASGRESDTEEILRAETLKKKHGIPGSALRLLAAFHDWQAPAASQTAVVSPPPPSGKRYRTVKEREMALRKAIWVRNRQIESEQGLPWGEMAREQLRIWKKSPDVMSEPELLRVWVTINGNANDFD